MQFRPVFVIARGELPADVDPAALICSLVAPIYPRLLVVAEPINDAVTDRAARAALASARAGAFGRSNAGASRDKRDRGD